MCGCVVGEGATCPSSTHILFDHSSHLFESSPAISGYIGPQSIVSTHVYVFVTLAMLMYICTMYLESSLNSYESVAILVTIAATEAH